MEGYGCCAQYIWKSLLVALKILTSPETLSPGLCCSHTRLCIERTVAQHTRGCMSHCLHPRCQYPDSAHSFSGENKRTIPMCRTQLTRTIRKNLQAPRELLSFLEVVWEDRSPPVQVQKTGKRSLGNSSYTILGAPIARILH